MLSVSKPLSVESAVKYYDRDNYYLESQGQWRGSIAEEFSLAGDINKDDFSQLLRGFNPIDGSKITKSAGNPKHRAGYDFTFSAPKSVSILAYKDARIEEAFQRALQSTLDYMDKNLAHAQLKKEGAVTVHRSEGLLFSTFMHKTSRELDPQLHAHCIVFNVTKKDGEIRGLQENPLYQNKMFLGQQFRNALASELSSLGYQIDITDRKKGLFEIKGVSPDIIEAFSKRSSQVKEEVKRLNSLRFSDLDEHTLQAFAKERVKVPESSPNFHRLYEQQYRELSQSKEFVYQKFEMAELAAIATLQSRVPKKNVTIEHITGLIEATCKQHDTTLDKILATAQHQGSEIKHRPVEEILSQALTAVTEQQSTFTKQELLRESYKLGIGEYTHKDFESAFADFVGKDTIRSLAEISSRMDCKEVFSSKEMIDIEAAVIDRCRKYKETCDLNVDKTESEDFIFHTDKGIKLGSLAKKDTGEINKLVGQVPAEDRAGILSLIEQARAHKADNSKPDPDVKEALSKHASLSKFLDDNGVGFTPGQKDAIRLITSTKCQFSVIQGDAGTGKSFSMLYAKELLESKGFTVRGFAPTGKAATELSSSAKIEDKECATIDSFLLRYRNSEPINRQRLGKEVWIVDEAGMCGSRKINEFMKCAEEAQAKVVFVGDRKQFASIEAGKMFLELQDKAGVDMVVMPDVMRQETQQTKDIVKAISLKEFDFAFSVMQGNQQQKIDVADAAAYSIGNKLVFKEDISGIPEGVECQVSRVSADKQLTLSYTDPETTLASSITIPAVMIPQDTVVLAAAQTDPTYRLGQTITFHDDQSPIPVNIPSKIEAFDRDQVTVSFENPTTGAIEKRSITGEQLAKASHTALTPEGASVAPNKPTYTNMITENADRGERLRLAATDYLSSIEDRKKCLLITGTNKDRNELNAAIRPALVEKGIVKESRKFTVFETNSLGGAAALAADSYKPGQVLLTQQKCADIARGAQCEIVAVHKNRNALDVKWWDRERSKYQVSTLDVPRDAKKISTFNKQEKDFGTGDLIIFLKNDKKIGVNNGQTADILSIDKDGNVTAKVREGEKKTVTFNINNRGESAYNYVDHAYAISDYKSQGATTDRLIWHAPTDAGPLSSNSFYVAITRCKKEVAVYTNDANDLKEKVRIEQHKESTLDYPIGKGTPRPTQERLESAPKPEAVFPKLPRTSIYVDSPLEKSAKLFSAFIREPIRISSEPAPMTAAPEPKPADKQKDKKQGLDL